MLTIWGRNKASLCDGVSRREFLRIGGLGLGGLCLPDLLRLRARADTGGRRSRKAVIMIYHYGGMPHLDMYDMKPDAPAEIRGEFKPIQTKVPGIQICELLPKHAEIMDKLAIIRNWEGHGGHDSGELLSGSSLGSGVSNDKRPAFGSVVSRLRGAVRDGMPQYVASHKYVSGSTAYLGQANAPFMPSGDLMKDLTLTISADQLAERKALLQSFDTLHRDLDVHARFDGMTAQALEMVTSNRVRDALDVAKEPLAIRARYGKATSWLQARRLVEAGVAVVSLDGGTDSFDTHEHNFPRLKKILPDFDQRVHALVTDLHDRGLEQDVAVVVWSEFSRTPKLNNLAGRDHFATGSVLMAGGGFKVGQAIGATDARAEKSIGTPYRAANVLATLYGVLGIDAAATTLPDLNGRPVYLLDDARKIAELV